MIAVTAQRDGDSQGCRQLHGREIKALLAGRGPDGNRFGQGIEGEIAAAVSRLFFLGERLLPGGQEVLIGSGAIRAQHSFAAFY